MFLLSTQPISLPGALDPTITAAIGPPPAVIAAEINRAGMGDLAAIDQPSASFAASLLSSSAIAPPRAGSVGGIELAAAIPAAGPGMNQMEWAYQPEATTAAPQVVLAAADPAPAANTLTDAVPAALAEGMTAYITHPEAPMIAPRTMVAAADPAPPAITVTETAPAVAEEMMAYANPVAAIGDIEQPFQVLFNPVPRPAAAAPTAVQRATAAPRASTPPTITTDHAWVNNPIPLRARSAAERRCLAAAIYFEARGEPVRGQMAVAQVVINRLKNPAYPDTVCGVVYQNQQMRNACQFSFACDGVRDVITERDAWALAQDIANSALRGQSEYLPEVGSSTHYHATYVHPNWADEMQRMTQIGTHIFYRTYGGGWI